MFVIGSGRAQTPSGGAVARSKSTVAFAFDIDGVLIRGGRVLPQAQRTPFTLRQSILLFTSFNLSLIYCIAFFFSLSDPFPPQLKLHLCLEALKLLSDSEGRPRVPIAFMTNGGGILEADKAKELSEWLNIKVLLLPFLSLSLPSSLQNIYQQEFRNVGGARRTLLLLFSEVFCFKVHKDQICLSHSPMHALNQRYKGKTVLVGNRPPLLFPPVCSPPFW